MTHQSVQVRAGMRRQQRMLAYLSRTARTRLATTRVTFGAPRELTSKRRRPSGGAALEDRASITASSPSAAQGDGSPSGTGLKRARTTGAATATFSDGKNDAYKDRFNNIATRRGGNIAAMEVVPGQSLCWRDSQRRARGTRGPPRRGCGPESGWPGDYDMC